jgi:DNA-directed RNA polymerase subunit RPC12/RpoP
MYPPVASRDVLGGRGDAGTDEFRRHEQDVAEASAARHQPSPLSRCGEALHESQHELESHAARLGKRAWLHCDDCRHSIMIEPREFAQQHGLDMLTPLLTISRAMRCTRCGSRKGCCWPETHDTRGTK